MLKLGICSDLHLDTYTHDFSKKIVAGIRKVSEEVDAIVIAGDLVNGLAKNIGFVKNLMGEDLMRRCIYVPGNHDYWDSSFGEFSNAKKDWPFLQVLDCQSMKLNNTTIYGGTLWFPAHTDMLAIGTRWADMAYIADSTRIFEEHRRFIKNAVPADIVISHHLPTFKSVHPKWANARSNIYFVSKQDALIKKIAPKIWVHGHAHDKLDYSYSEKTRVICNPCGYPNENSIEYKPVVIEV